MSTNICKKWNRSLLVVIFVVKHGVRFIDVGGGAIWI